MAAWKAREAFLYFTVQYCNVVIVINVMLQSGTRGRFDAFYDFDVSNLALKNTRLS